MKTMLTTTMLVLFAIVGIQMWVPTQSVTAAPTRTAPANVKAQEKFEGHPALQALIAHFPSYRGTNKEDFRWEYLEVVKKKSDIENGKILVTRVFLEDVRDEVEYELLTLVSDVFSDHPETVHFILRGDAILAAKTNQHRYWVVEEGTRRVYTDLRTEQIPISKERESWVKQLASIGEQHPLKALID